MAYVVKQLGAVSGTSASGTIYTVPAGTKAIIKSIVADYNPGGNSRTLSVLAKGVTVLKMGTGASGTSGLYAGAASGQGHNASGASGNAHQNMGGIDSTFGSYGGVASANAENLVLNAGDTVTFTQSASDTYNIVVSGIEVS